MCIKAAGTPTTEEEKGFCGLMHVTAYTFNDYFFI